MNFKYVDQDELRVKKRVNENPGARFDELLGGIIVQRAKRQFDFQNDMGECDLHAAFNFVAAYCSVAQFARQCGLASAPSEEETGKVMTVAEIFYECCAEAGIVEKRHLPRLMEVSEDLPKCSAHKAMEAEKQRPALWKDAIEFSETGFSEFIEKVKQKQSSLMNARARFELNPQQKKNPRGYER